ncbi:MAG: SBBP repeat-containing protein [Chloroflexi bacterium]|nr:SBBP repeat-containing protein [Chloroflexota bacterium]
MGRAIAVDGSGNVYVAGQSTASWGSPVRPYTAALDAYVARLNAATGALTWNTFLGGTGTDVGNSIAVDSNDSVSVVGQSSATWGSPVRPYTAGDDAYAARLNAATGALTWHTFLGGTGADVGNSIAVDSNDSVSVVGQSSATWGSPVRPYTAADAFVAQLDVSTGALTWNSFLGGADGGDVGYAVAMDGNVYVAGSSSASGQSGAPCHRWQ